MRNKILHKFFVRSFKSFKQPRRLQNGIPLADKRTNLLGKSKSVPLHFFEEKEICTPVYSEYFSDYKKFYEGIAKDIQEAKERRTYVNESATHPNWFDASYISWENYDSLNIELPDGYLYFMPIINWGRFKKEFVVDPKTEEPRIRLMMPLTVRMNHAIADGYQVAKVFELVRKECENLTRE